MQLVLPSVRKAIRTEGSGERELTAPSRRSHRRRGPGAPLPSPGRGAWSSLPPHPACRSSPAPACGSQSRPAAAPSAAPAQTSGGLGPRRVHCQWKIWKKGRSRPEQVVTYPCSRWQSDISTRSHPQVKKPTPL